MEKFSSSPTPPASTSYDSLVVAAKELVRNQQMGSVSEVLTPIVGADIHPYNIEDFLIVRGVLFIRGIVEHSPADVPDLLFRHRSFLYRMTVRADKIHASSETRTAFSASLDLNTLDCDGADHTGSLLICFKSEHVVLNDLSSQRMRNDRFLMSEKPFWDAIHQKPTGSLVEIGSRARSGITRRQSFPKEISYTGFDICEGENVDVVGDAHELSRYFPEECFDFAFSVSVWEHLAMPWKVSLELNRILKTGGVAMINSHQCWPSHEEPWDYFRFSEYSWSTLFNAYTGFEILACGQGIPGIVAPAIIQPNISDMEWHYAYLASRVVVRKISRTQLSWEVPTHAVASGNYPK